MTKKNISEVYPKRRAFITGAGNGLGLAFALYLAKHNWKIGLSDINQTTLEKACELVRQAGGEPHSFVFDVSDYSAFDSSVRDFCSVYGGIDVGINNAGIGCGGLIENVSIDQFRKVIDINLMGVVNGCHLFAPLMKAQRAGHILNVASTAAFAAAPRMSAYNTSKAAVLALSETLCAELLDDNVRISVLMPGYVRTNIGIDSIGCAIDANRGRLMVEQSTIMPDTVAEESFRRMAAGDLYIVLPEESRFLWRFKRFFPDSYWRFISSQVKKRIARLDKVAASSQSRV